MGAASGAAPASATKSPTSGPTTGATTARPPAATADSRSLANSATRAGEGLVVGRLHLAQHRQPRRRGERVSRQRARLVDGTARRQLGHQLAPPAERAHRQPAADHLAEAPEVRRHAGPAGRPRRPEPEAGDDLVEDEEGTAGAAGGAQPLEKPGQPAPRGSCWPPPARRSRRPPARRARGPRCRGRPRCRPPPRRTRRPSRAGRAWPRRSPRRPAGRRSGRGSSRRT